MTSKTSKSVITDFIALAEHKVSGRADNWDGSTQGQLRATIREARECLAKAALEYEVFVEGGGVSPLLIAAFGDKQHAMAYAMAQTEAAQAEGKLDVYTLLGPQGEVEYWL